MTPPDLTMVKVLRAVDEAEKERSPVSPDLVAQKSGLLLQEVRERLAEASSKKLVYYYNSVEETSLPTAPGWTLTAAGQTMIEETD